MVKNKNNLEEARIKRKVNEQNRRDRIKNDQVLYEEFKRKERERYHNRKKKGQLKLLQISLIEKKEPSVRNG